MYRQGLLNFYIDDLFTNETLLIIPKASFQNKLVSVLKSDRIFRFHEKQYSLIAYPFSTKYQNSNQWVLEILAHANESSANNRTQIQAYLRSTQYIPHIINIGSIAKIGAGFKTNVFFDDHPIDEQRSNSFSVVTVDSVASWIEINDLAERIIEF